MLNDLCARQRLTPIQCHAASWQYWPVCCCTRAQSITYSCFVTWPLASTDLLGLKPPGLTPTAKIQQAGAGLRKVLTMIPASSLASITSNWHVALVAPAMFLCNGRIRENPQPPDYFQRFSAESDQE